MALFNLNTHTTHAYFMTNAGSETLSDGVVFTMQYRFGTEKHDLGMPFWTNYGTEKSTTTLQYRVYDSNNNPVSGKSQAIILGKNLPKGDMYTVPKGFAQTFTLAVAFIPDNFDTHESYRLQVEYLPFNFDGVQNLQLNPSELKYYTTASTPIDSK